MKVQNRHRGGGGNRGVKGLLKISIKPTLELPITCAFDQEFTVDTSVNVAQKDFETDGEGSTGVYGFEMNLFESDAFRTKRTEMVFRVGEEIYFQIDSLATNPASNLRYQVTSCGLSQGKWSLSLRVDN